MAAKSVPRFQQVLLPILREGLGPGVAVRSWIDDIDQRTYPMVNIRRIGGTRDGNFPNKLDHPVVEITAYTDEGLIETEELYSQALDVLYAAQRKQILTPAGYITNITETMGMTQFSSLFIDTWRVQGLIRLGIRPLRTS
ncbi:tail terminator [Rhodococcus phage AngryOrchard]|uniref:Tail terminator n=1 Tax=Rhodococcus phage AngryOrchard TaxID=1955425 RepID=A0A1S5VY34_9CAUD|nr:tail terminator [Rhodococcus phage AngryOrchard]